MKRKPKSVRMWGVFVKARGGERVIAEAHWSPDNAWDHALAGEVVKPVTVSYSLAAKPKAKPVRASRVAAKKGKRK